MDHRQDPQHGLTPVELTSRAGRPLAGELHEHPAGSTAVVICHGMLSSMRSEKHRALAARLWAQGHAVLRFDFTARGQSLERNPGWPPGRITYTDQIEDLAGAIAFLRERILPPRLFLVGSSMGGATAVLYAATDAGVAGIVTFASPADSTRPRDEVAHVDMGPLDRATYLEDARGHDILAAARALRCPVRHIHGTADQQVPVAQGRLFASAGGELVTIDGADHVFGDDAHRAALLDAAVAFIEANRRG